MSEYPTFEYGMYTPNSQKKVSVTCEFNVSDKCTCTKVMSYRDIRKNKMRKDGKYICFFCSRTLKFSGRNNPNPNTKYEFDDHCMDNVDTEAKAYLLGWIASDGCISRNRITICIHERDYQILENLKSIICAVIPISHVRDNMISISFSSMQMCNSVCNYLNISQGKKSDVIQLPKFEDDMLYWAFVRGVFDGDGNIRSRTNTRKSPDCSISSNSATFLFDIAQRSGIKHNISHNQLNFYGCNSIDFLSKIYDGSSAQFRLERKYKQYLDWVQTEYTPIIGKGRAFLNECFVGKTDERAIIPSKNHASDVGWDLTIIEKTKSISDLIHMYDTGIKVMPQSGFYVEVVPRSSLSKTGYMLVNSVGIIDQSYLGSIKIVLVKVDPSMPDIELPCRCAQMIIRKYHHAEVVEVESDFFEETERGAGGFGSTDQKK